MHITPVKHPLASSRNQPPLHQNSGQPSTPHILNDNVSNDNQSSSTLPTDPIQTSSHKLVSHVASSSSIDHEPIHNTWSDTMSVNFKQTNPIHNFSTTPMPNYMCRNPNFVPTYFVTEPTDDSPPSSPIQNEYSIVKPLAITDGIDIIEENLSKLSVKRKPCASLPNPPAKKRSKQPPKFQSVTPNPTTQSVKPTVPTHSKRNLRKFTSPKIMSKSVSSSVETQLNNLVEVPIEIMYVDDSFVSNVGVVAAPDQPHASCFFYVNPIGRSGGLALWWKDSITLNTVNGDKNIIMQISHLALSATCPFFVIGDFYLIGDVADKHGGSSNTSSRIEEFQSLLSTSELFELPFKGLNYTWDNKRAGNANIQERIDRALANEMLLKLVVTCEDTVHNAWSDSSSSNLIASLEWNLDRCAKDLTSWSRKHFRNNRKVIQELTNELRIVQSAAPTADNNARQRLLQKKLEETWRKEKMFWHQRSRVNWIKFGDQNTRFFHLSMIHRSQRNAITMLKNEEGEWVDDVVALNTLIKNHFTSIYTSVGVREFGDVLDVIQPTVTEHMNTSLVDTIADNERHQAKMGFQVSDQRLPNQFRHDIYSFIESPVGSERYSPG
nr:reverse transcriptase [Tanacetum cinerariifolium]